MNLTIRDTGILKSDPYVLVDENEHVLAASYEQNGEHTKAGLQKLVDELATLRAQLEDAKEIIINIAYLDNFLSPEEKHEFISVSVKVSDIKKSVTWYKQVTTA